MKRFLALCIVWLLLAASAQAQPFHNVRLDDPLSRPLVCTGIQEARMLGPHYARISIFSVPEPDGRSERLYIGFVDDLQDLRANSFLWRGPVAARWKGLRTVPEYKSSYTAPNPKRYRIDRLTALPGGRVQTNTMEIDLEAKPAQLRRVGGPGQPMYPTSEPLGDSLPMNDSLRLLVRLSEQQTFNTDVLSLRSYEIYQGKVDPPVDRFVGLHPWEAPPDSHLLAVCRKDDPGQGILRFLPMRPYGWKMEKPLKQPADGDIDGVFVLQMLSQYLVPSEYNEQVTGELMKRAARYRVSVSLRKLAITTLERDLEYDYTREDWTPPEPVKKAKSTPCP